MSFDTVFQLAVGIAFCLIGLYFARALNMMTNHDISEEKK